MPKKRARKGHIYNRLKSNTVNRILFANVCTKPQHMCRYFRHMPLLRGPLSGRSKIAAPVSVCMIGEGGPQQFLPAARRRPYIH